MILTVNSGSTSVKLAAFEAGRTLRLVKATQHSGGNLAASDILSAFIATPPGDDIRAVAHRVVHGGTRFREPVLIDDEILKAIEPLSALAPLHNPQALRWIGAARERCGEPVKHVAVFDTAFFARLPPVAAQYAVEPAVTALGVRRYGFHGIAHEAMWQRWRELNPALPDGGRLITLQLGGGSSMAAIDRGRPIEVSMGFSPLEGLVMATRSGDIDPAVIPYLEERLGLASAAVVEKLNRESGLVGLAGESDMSRLLAAADVSEEARFAVELYGYRARKYLGAFITVLGGCDGIVFGGGIGEHAPQIRERILEDLKWLGIELDRAANAAACRGEARLEAPESRVRIAVLPADEALSLARAALSLMKSG